MGYWNQWRNFNEWAEVNAYQRICKHCGESFIPRSGNQKYCAREDNPECDDDRYFEKLWNKGRHPLQLAKNFLE